MAEQTFCRNCGKPVCEECRRDAYGTVFCAEHAPAPAAGGAQVHVVEPNQDLNTIAMMYGVRVEEIMKLNGLASPEVKVGQTLKIPPPVE